MAASAILVDLDGTVWDSIPWYALVLSGGDAVRAVDVELRLRQGESVIGIARERGFTKTAFVQRCRQHLEELRLFPTVRETLAVLDRRGVPMGIVTSLSGDLASAMLEGSRLGHHFQTIIHPGRCRSGKASGVPLRRALNHLRIAPSAEVFYIGDREDDAACARACGVSFAWASYGYGVRPPRGSTILRRFDEVLEL